MDWTDLQIKVATHDSDTAAAIALMAAGGGIYIEDYSDLVEEAPRIAHIDLIDEELLNKDREHVIIHLYVSADNAPGEVRLFLTERLAAAGIACELLDSSVREEDWATAWKAYYRPVEISPRLIICPSWLTCEPKPGQTVMRLDPGMAFGTGTHETTRLCLALLEHALRPGASVLDLGCGSGILSIAAKLLGAGRTAGVDIDPLAVRMAKENAKENAITDIDYTATDLLSGIGGTYDIVVANIVADVIIRLLSGLDAVLAPGGVFIASGIIDERAHEVYDAVERSGLVITERREANGWAALSARRPAAGEAR